MIDNYYQQTDRFTVYDDEHTPYEVIEETRFIKRFEPDGGVKTEESGKFYRLASGQPVDKIDTDTFEITDAVRGFFIRAKRA